MNTDLHKRFEEAAKGYADKKFPKHRASENDRKARENYQLCRDSCIAGAELGYKEAIKVAKEWIRDRNSYACKEWLDKECADFEAYMNKLLKEN